MILKISFQRTIINISIFSLVAVLTACGGGSSTSGSKSSSQTLSTSSLVSSAYSSSSSSRLPTHLMGGAIQGNALNLSNIVSTFAGAAEGADGIGAAARFKQPLGLATDGTSIYVADTQNYTVRKINIQTGEVATIAGMASTRGIADGIGPTARFFSPVGITISGTQLYVTDTQSNTIRRISIATGEVTTFAGNRNFQGNIDGFGINASFSSPRSITTDGTNLYVVCDAKIIRKIVIATGLVSTLPTPSNTFIQSITSDGTNLYAVSDSGLLLKIVISTGAYTTLNISSQDSIVASSIVTDGINLYVANAYKNTINRIVIATGIASTLAGTVGVSGSADGLGMSANFNGPAGIAMNGNNIYVADANNNTIRKFVTISSEVTTLAGSADITNSSDGMGGQARFYYPGNITTDGSNLYVSDNGNKTIRKIDIATKTVTTLAGTAGISGSDDGVGAAASFGSPEGITTDGTNLFVADGNTIRQISLPTGAVTTLAGSSDVWGNTDGVGKLASFRQPRAITTDGTNVYVGDSVNYTIRKILITTGEVTTLAGSAGNGGCSDGIGAAANFISVGGMTTDGLNLYLTDAVCGTVRKIELATGTVATIAGKFEIGSNDGSGVNASFYSPEGITTDGTNLYVSDTYNNTIRKIVIASGYVTTIAGTPGVTTGSAEGAGPLAVFSHPTGITTDGTNVYVTDTNNSTIRKID